VRWVPQATGIYPFYCTDFCSALHQEMQGYVRVSAPELHVPLSANVSKIAQTQNGRMQSDHDEHGEHGKRGEHR
jgi:nitrous-oxide reductase